MLSGILGLYEGMRESNFGRILGNIALALTFARKSVVYIWRVLLRAHTKASRHRLCLCGWISALLFGGETYWSPPPRHFTVTSQRLYLRTRKGRKFCFNLPKWDNLPPLRD
jgi:hypothetical protein